MFKYYPFENYRPGTEEAIREIEALKSKGKRFILVHGPTGSGKSGLAVAFARSEKAIITTPTKLLQEQYASTKEFNQEYTVFGKSNYQCDIKGFTELSVDESICCSDTVTKEFIDFIPWSLEDGFKKKQESGISRNLKQVCAAKGVCPYYSKIAKIGRVPGAVVNYDLLAHLKKSKDKSGIDFGESIVMDEAHALLDKARSVYGYTITDTTAERLLGKEAERDVGEGVIAWLNRLYTFSGQLLEEETNAREAAKLSKFNSKLRNLLQLGIDDENKFHIKDDDGSVEIKPLDLRMLKKEIFDPFKTVLLLSATFPANFCELLGIEEDEVAHVYIPSSFLKENRPIIYLQNAPAINWKTVLEKNHFAIKAIDVILNKHKNNKGIIHCANYRLFNQLKKIFKTNKRFIWVDRDTNKTQAINFHSGTDNPTVLVSPSMMEGVDLKDDLARFQVLLKVPFSALDDYTRKMMEIFPGFYENDTITRIIQAYGRAVRSAEDSATFYILDGAFGRLAKQHHKLFSQYFLEALAVANA